jgi:hypothetical protein
LFPAVKSGERTSTTELRARARATHGSEHGWHRRTGNYPAVVEALLEAGAKLPKTVSGTDPVKEVLRRHSSKTESREPTRAQLGAEVVP